MITACILAKNSERTLSATLDSLSFFHEIIVLDTGSADQTKEIAQKYPNVVVHSVPFTQFGKLRNQAAALAKNEWILAIDSDEVLSTALQKEIQSLTLDPFCVYEIDFRNFYNGRWIKGCGWHPERHIRLYHKNRAQFSEQAIHEGIIYSSPVRIQALQHPLLHAPYLSISDFLRKMQLYSDLFAEQYQGKRKASFSRALIHSFFSFIRSYFFKRGCCMGKEGFIISFYNANVAFYKYLKLAERNRNRP
jgi:glycosyltransferase involved in cell wall biosynthesis